MPEQAPELIALIQNSFAAVDLQFQYWLSITFSAVVASFLARKRLGTRLRFALATLYTLAALQILLVSLAHLERGAFLAAALADLGVDSPKTYLPAVAAIRRVVFALGTFAAIVFILRPGIADELDSSPPLDTHEE